MSEGAPKDVSKTGEEPTKIIEIGGKKFELGPFFGKKSWDDMNEMITDVNSTLTEGEKPWRIFNKKEYDEIFRPIRVIKNEGLPFDEMNKKITEYIKGLGFQPKTNYWSSTVDNFDFVYEWSTDMLGVGTVTKNDKLLVQCIREV